MPLCDFGPPDDTEPSKALPSEPDVVFSVPDFTGPADHADVAEQLWQRYPKLFYAIGHHLSTHHAPLRFDNRLWMPPILKDNNPNQIWIKASQVGMSTLAFASMFAFAKQGLRGLYILPDVALMRQFIRDRLDNLVSRVPEYRSAIGEMRQSKKAADSSALKSIYGNGWLFAGATTPKSFFVNDTDVIFIDEYDLCVDKGNLDLAYTRQGASEHPHTIRLGNPTTPGSGIHKMFEEMSDCRYWHVKCGSCGHAQVLDWFINFVSWEDPRWVLKDPSGQPVCIECGTAFDRLGPGEWIAKYPEKLTSGYQISKLFAAPQPRTITEMLERYNLAHGSSHKTQIFYRFDLGLPYIEATAQINIKDIQTAISPKVPFYGSVESAKGVKFEHPIVIGVDQPGYMCIEQLVGETRQLIHCSRFMTWAKLEEAMSVFGASTVVIDEGGGDWLAGEGAQALRKKHPGRVFTCKYTALDKEDNKRILHYEPGGRVVVNRQESLDFTAQAFRNGRMLLPNFIDKVCGGEFQAHVLSSMRVMVDKGEFKWPRWVKGPHGDDYRHADNYAYVASLIYRQKGPAAESRPLTATEIELRQRAFG